LPLSIDSIKIDLLLVLFHSKKERAWVELQNEFGDSERDCTQEDIPNLKYLEYCIKETLRLYPSVPGFERVVQEDVQIGKPENCCVLQKSI
jgi:cytochrome P450